jgi:hypothetical protein
MSSVLDHRRLDRDREEAVDHPGRAEPGHRQGHLLLADGVHVGGDDRQVDLDIAAEPGS